MPRKKIQEAAEDPYYHQKVYLQSKKGKEAHREAQERYRKSQKGREVEIRRLARLKRERRLKKQQEIINQQEDKVS